MPVESAVIGRAGAAFRPSPVASAAVLYRAAALADATSRQVWLIAIMLFCLTATNGRPFWWNSAIPAAAMSLWLIGSRGPERIMAQALSKQNAAIFWCLLLLTIWSGLSALIAADFVAGRTFILRCFLPLLVYFSVVGLRLKRAHSMTCLLAIIAGSTVPLSVGLLAFYREIGIPDLGELLYAKFDMNRMSNYMDVTFGNPGHMGMFAEILAPCVFVAIYALAMRRSLRIISGLWLGLVLVNVVVAGSRTSWGITIVVGAGIVLALHRGLTVLLLAGALMLSGLYIASSELIDDKMVAERVFPAIGRSGRDVSVEERMDSIGIGWETFRDNLVVGVGPGLSGEHNVYAVPHQSIVMIASETGAPGGLFFTMLNVVVFWRTVRHAWRAMSSDLDRRRLMWIAGPFSWLLGGLIAGITFNLELAILWVGIFHAMLGLYGFQDGAREIHSPASSTRASVA